MGNKRLVAGLVLLLSFHAASCVDLKFWEYFYSSPDATKSPLEKLRGYDRARYKEDLDNTLDHLLVLSDTVNELSTFITQIKIHGGETVQSIAAILKYNDFVTGAKDDEGATQATTNTSAVGINALLNSQVRSGYNSSTDKKPTKDKAPEKKKPSHKQSLSSFELGHLEIETGASTGASLHEARESEGGWLSRTFGHLYAAVRQRFSHAKLEKSKAFILKTKANPLFAQPPSDASHALIALPTRKPDPSTAANNTVVAPTTFNPTRETKNKIKGWEEFLQMGESVAKDLSAMNQLALTMLSTNRKIIEQLKKLPPPL